MSAASSALIASLFAQAAGLAPGPAAPDTTSVTPPPIIAPSPAERRAVRGRPLDEESESPELREVRRFEQAAFSRQDGVTPPGRSPEDDQALPEGLRGRWGGTGDVPDEL